MVLGTIIVYMVFLMLVGYWSNKKITEMDDFLLAGRRLGLLLTAGALAATHFGGGMVMGGGESGFLDGFSAAWYGLACGIGLILLGFLTASKFRALSFYTVPDYLEYRYGGKTLRILGAVLSIIAIIGIIAAQVGAARGALAILGFEGNSGAIVATLIFIIYTAIGGLWAATITDFFQVIIAGVGVILAAALVWGDAGGLTGLNEMIETSRGAVESGYFNLFGIGGSAILFILLPTVMYTLIGQDFYQRLFAAKDNITARNASFLGGIFLIIMSIFPVIIGIAGKGYFPELTEENAGTALPMVIEEILPLGVAAIVLAALLAAIMSTADSLLTAGTAHLVNDLWIKLRDDDYIVDKKNMLKISRIFTVVLGLLSLIIALLIPGIIRILIYSYSMYVGGVFIPVIGGLLWKKASAKGALVALIAGSLIALSGIIFDIQIAGIPVVVYSGLVSLILFIVVSPLTPAEK